MPFTRPLAQKIIDFWYEGIVTLPYATIPKDLQKKWFLSNDPALDQSIRSTYEEQLIQLAQELNQPNIQEILDASSPLTQDNVCGIGAIILLDQFPRNMYRGTGKAFAYDHLACMLSKKLIHRLNSFPMNQRGTLLLPLMHSEKLEDQDSLLEYTQQWIKDCESYPDLLNSYVQPFYKMAVIHRDLIQRFRRFPYRNALLNRASTSEEEEFLKSNNQNFGQSSTEKA